MLKKMPLYVGMHVLRMTLMVLVVLLGLDFMLSFIGELDNLSETYSSVQALFYLGMQLPIKAYDYLPVAILVGILIGLGGLANANELVVLRAAGISLTKILSWVLYPLFALIAAMMLIGEWVIPELEERAEIFKAQTRSGGVDLAVHGVWHREGQDDYYFDALGGDGLIYGVVRYRFDAQGRMQESLHADKAYYNQDHWILAGVRRAQMQTNQLDQVPRIDSRILINLRWETGLTPELMRLLLLDNRRLSLQDLWAFAQFRQAQGLDVNELMMNFWRKGLLPSTTGSLILVGAAFIFGPLRSVAASTRVFYGIVTGLVVKYAQDLLGPASTLFGFDPIWATLGPSLLCILFGLALLRRVA